jgi:hypothetical protein
MPTESGDQRLLGNYRHLIDLVYSLAWVPY